MVKKAKIAPVNDVPEKPVSQEVQEVQQPAEVPADATPGAEEAAAKPAVGPKARGPRGVDESAKITLLHTENPKRPGTRAFELYKAYVDGMTIKEFADALEKLGTEEGKQSTPALVYDAKHGFISIEGYDPGAIVQPRPKAEPKAPKEKKSRKKKDAAEAKTTEENEKELEAETETETMD